MHIFLVLTLLTIAIVVVWVWLLRRRKPDSATIENASPQAADVNPPRTELSESLEVAPAAPLVPQIPPLTFPDAPIPATTEVSSGEDAAAVPMAEEVQPRPFPPELVNTSIKDGSEPSDASHDELPVTESRVPTSLPNAYALPNGLVTESAITNKDLIESGSLTETATADTTAPALLPRFEVESDAPDTPKLPLPETEPIPNPPTYHPPTPPSPRRRTSDARERTPRSMQRADADLRLRVQLVFGRGGTVNTLALVPDRREGMAREVEITGTQGELRLMEQSNDCYEPVPLSDAANVLRQGVEWRGRSNARHWRWMLSRRELYVLAPGDEFGLYGFISTARLRLNIRHMILATTALRDQVLTALADAGCAAPDVNDDNTSGVPPGWILFRNVTPTCAVPMRDNMDILNVLCPAHEIEPHFVGGIRLERNTWLAGFPPRIRFTGELGDGFQVMIDGKPAWPTTDGAFEATDWDTEGEHRLWFADRTETYSLRTMDERWDRWKAHDFGTGAAICGAGIQRINSTHWHQARVPATNLLLIGARPGEIFRCEARYGMRSETILAFVPFAPTWALPIDPIHSDNRSACLVLLNSIEPVYTARPGSRGRKVDRALREWVVAINDAGRKQLKLANASEDTNTLWRRYRAVAKWLWKRVR